MADKSLLDSVLEHDADALIVYGAFALALAAAGVFGADANPAVVAPALVLVGFLVLVGYHYRRSLRSE